MQECAALTVSSKHNLRAASCAFHCHPLPFLQLCGVPNIHGLHTVCLLSMHAETLPFPCPLPPSSLHLLIIPTGPRLSKVRILRITASLLKPEVIQLLICIYS